MTASDTIISQNKMHCDKLNVHKTNLEKSFQIVLISQQNPLSHQVPQSHNEKTANNLINNNCIGQDLSLLHYCRHYQQYHRHYPNRCHR